MSRRVRLMFEVVVADGDDVDCVGDALVKVSDSLRELSEHDLAGAGGADEYSLTVDEVSMTASVSRP